MNAFSVEEAAAAEIRRIFNESNCREPVARIFEMADPGNLFDDLKLAVLDGRMSKEELAALGKERLKEVEDQLMSFLCVEACERASYALEDLFETNGITFVMAPSTREELADYRLTFEAGRFLLRGADNVAHTFRSLARDAQDEGPL